MEPQIARRWESSTWPTTTANIQPALTNANKPDLDARPPGSKESASKHRCRGISEGTSGTCDDEMRCLERSCTSAPQKSHMSKWEIISLALSCESAARIYESNWCVVGQLADFANISTLAELIVKISRPYDNDEGTVHQIKRCKTHLRAAVWGALYCDCSPQVGSLRDWSIYSS